MIKRYCLIIVALALILCGCSSYATDIWKELNNDTYPSGTENWKILTIEGCGTFKIPNDWEYFFQDEVIYIMSNEKPIMISYERTGENETNSFYSDFRYIDMLTSAVFSNSAIYGKAKYSYSGKEIERYYLSLGETKEGKWIEFLVWDTDVSEELLIKIAKTVRLE